MSLLAKVPGELLIMIMSQVDSPLDLQSFISAWPKAFLFFDHERRRFLEPFIEDTFTHFEARGYDYDDDDDRYDYDGYVDVPSLALHAVTCRLRYPTRKYLGPIDPRRQILKKGSGGGVHSLFNDLPATCGLYELCLEADLIAWRYASNAWHHIQRDPGLLSVIKPTRANRRLLSLDMRKKEWLRFKEAFFRFEAERHILPHDFSLLCPTSPDPGRNRHPLDGPLARSSLTRLRWHHVAAQCMFFFVFGQFCLLVEKVEIGLYAADTLVHERNQHNAMAQTPGSGRRSLHDHLQRHNVAFYFLAMAASERLVFIYSLCIQGCSLLLRMEGMNGQDLEDFVLVAFFHQRRSPSTPSSPKWVDLAMLLSSLTDETTNVCRVWKQAWYFWASSSKDAIGVTVPL
ncbi:hypothetical protein FALBO_9209 [Fusarium albosuccineum]|uniref:Uncharacterized protein n=1 Tax=Fusarium albosuccineum TaxID=1237068 RepID=A0A8H4LAA7_9HYPO|nr:hypothetical protein FALBO_9209 [Fusarium albosuccineum]